ncbi:Haemolysin-III_related (plasmid) [Leishmania braziliensis MHOM/BR/75/M2904]|uniref:Haemolysin-III_related n=1 Tax=Leishmania braziliensis MHOM/BR/75/M2904 TaxID=420245 RepID=A0A3P3YY61_LEIBR|nr:Haemolysin-III_related [Leishmania braziliensis MHOM/BR/75/M2904]
MGPKHLTRTDLTSPQDMPRHNDDVPIGLTATMQRGQGGPSSFSSDGSSPAALSSAGSLWSRVGREIASWRRGTVSIYEVDAWLRFNPYIRRGFRHRSLRKREALGSLVLYLHNETFNVVSHLAMVVLMALLLLWPPRVTAMSNSGSGAYFSERSAGEPFRRHHRAETEVPSWLRGLDRRAATPGAAAAETDKDRVQGYVPPGDVAGSPRHVLSDAAAGAATPSSTFRFFAVLLGDLAAPSSPMMPVIDTALPPPPMSVDTRLSLSLIPLVVLFLLTFSLSVLYHLFMPCCRTPRGYQQLLQCDVLGVVFAISGSAYAYFACGMPCAGESAQLWTGALMVVTTLLCIYVLVLAPMWGVVAEVCALALCLAQWAAAAVIAAVLEFLMGRPLLSAPPCPPPVQRDRHGGRDRQPRPLPPPPELHAGQHFLLAWVQRHRHLSSAGLGSASTASSTAAVASTTADPVPVSARQRIAVVGVYCLLHLGVYLALVHPKSRPAMGGFTQATHYHNASYAWLFLGGLVNASRFPEVVVFHWTRRAAHHTRRVAAAEAAALSAEKLRRDAGMTEVDARAAAAASSSLRGSARSHCPSSVGVAPESAAQATSVPSTSLPPVTAVTLWDRLCVPKLVVTYVVSASTLDYIGNSHHIWHVCTALSALSAILAVYYDCMEYDLVQCG